jgi:hypothetical protein
MNLAIKKKLESEMWIYHNHAGHCIVNVKFIYNKSKNSHRFQAKSENGYVLTFFPFVGV